jgi:hypothetical protein
LKNLLIFSTLLLMSFDSMAVEGVCLIKQKNAAAYTFAQAAGIPVQTVEIVKFEPGEWTNNESDNVGSDRVTVLGERPNRGPTISTYTVKAKQVGSFQTCEILSVE